MIHSRLLVYFASVAIFAAIVSGQSLSDIDCVSADAPYGSGKNDGRCLQLLVQHDPDLGYKVRSNASNRPSRFEDTAGEVVLRDAIASKGGRFPLEATGREINPIAPTSEKFEYQFIHFDDDFNDRNKIQNEITPWNLIGYQLKAKRIVFVWCDTREIDATQQNQGCKRSAMYVFERPEGREERQHQLLVSGKREAIARTIEERMMEGYRPSMVLSESSVLLDKVSDKPQQAEVMVLRPGVRVSPENKINKLAKEGFRVTVFDMYLVVMTRTAETRGKPTRYHTLNGNSEDVQKDLSKLSQRGVRYIGARSRIVSPRRAQFLFEDAPSGQTRSQFKTVGVQHTKIDGDVVTFEPTEESKKLEANVNSLLRQGYRIVDITDASSNQILLERKN